VLLGATCFMLAGAPVTAQDDAPADDFDRSSEDCIWLPQLDRTEVIDDRTILFHQNGGRVYRNYLPRECPGLEREKRFMYEARNGRLCSIDTIAVLEQWGVGLARGFTCSLGEFQPITTEEVEELKAAAERRKESERRRD
jgi:hypothetical protein